MKCSRGVAGDPVGRIHQAQRGGRDDRLLHRHVRVALRDLQEAVRVAAGSGTGPRVSRGMRRTWPAANGILKPSGAVFGSPCTRVGPEVVILPLLAVRDHRRAGGLEPRDRVADRRFVERGQARIVAVVLANAWMSCGGRGMLPMGSVGMVMALRFGDRGGGSAWFGHMPRGTAVLMIRAAKRGFQSSADLAPGGRSIRLTAAGVRRWAGTSCRVRRSRSQMCNSASGTSARSKGTSAGQRACLRSRPRRSPSRSLTIGEREPL